MEVSVIPVRLQQDSGDASVSAVVVTSGPAVDILDPPPLTVRIRGMRLFRRWMLLPVRKLTFGPPGCQHSRDASVSAVDVNSGPEVYFLDRPCCRDPAELRTPVCQMYCEPVKELQLGVWRISNVREYPRVS